ncbi:hypothetical protein GI584_07860 [Gracilibacillus salitolerans]|uniref:NTF2-like N-terminal transpeptidase domain-containing protein n=1 Tax=Gracilibacillus salitolerans TaxID=2663022 RepID=A0A5Q2TS65_9BACI|nr:hypothetical protein [Gracilibacillus salitolerans]QGH36962.1 hypothetical protein GI584_07860 [Gracilibacillus salitolerans]
MKIRRYNIRKNRQIIILLGLIFSLALVALVVFSIMHFFSTEREVEKVAVQFYEYEQNGDFSNSWEMFHSSMKNRFDKSDYIQDRAHVFLEHFGVKTFDFTLSDPVKIENYKLNTNLANTQTVYRIVVTYIYQSKYGYLEIDQPIILTEEDREWRILWEYEE